MLRYARDPLGFYADCARRFGDVFTIPTVLGPLVVSADPEGVRSIFALPPASFSRWSTDSVSPLLGEASLLLSGGARHARDRKLLTPPFHGERMRAYGAVMRAAALREAASWAAGSAVSMQEAGSAISIDVILRAVFGVDEAAGLDELRAALLGALASMSPLLMLFPALRRRFGGIGPYARMVRVRDRLDALTYDAIARRRARGGDGGGDDILGLMLSARYDDGSAMTDGEIRDQLLTLVFAGHETSGIALAWAVNWLARTPPVRHRLVAELSALGDDPAPLALAAAPYLEAVCHETLRLYPVVGEVVRLLRAPLTLGAWTIPAGVPVSAGIALVHARPDLYPEPEAFRPERFLERKFAPHEYLPFGGGARRCIGAAFALYEMKVVLGTLLAHHRFTLVREERERPVMRNLAMGPKRRVRVKVSPRDSKTRGTRVAARKYLEVR
jgi:cytochrome P450 family 110